MAWPTSGAFRTALRSAHSLAVRVEAWRSGAMVDASLPIVSGEVTVDLNNRIRRVLHLTVPGTQAMWNLLSPVGTELRAYRGIRFPDGSEELVPLGIFDIDDQQMGYNPSGTLSLTARDRWVRVTRSKFEQARRTSAGNAVDIAVGLVDEVIPGTPRVIEGAPFVTTTRAAVWQGERDEAIGHLAAMSAADMYFDPVGRLIVRLAPKVTASAPVWTIDASTSGVLINAERTRSRDRTCSVVVVSAANTDGVAPFAPVKVADTNPKSPTYVSGPFGRVPYFYTNPLIRSQAVARTTAEMILDRVSGLAAQLTVESVVHPGLDAGDVILVSLPRQGGRPQIERHLIETVTVPLTAGAAQSITTRSSRPEDTIEGGGDLSTRSWADLLNHWTWREVLQKHSTWHDVLLRDRS